MTETGKLNIILGSHAHVPSGASDSEFEYVYENLLRPFVSALYRYSNIQAVLHYSGVLLYWIERNHPEFFMLIEDMVARKQAEILGGGFYEPILPVIPLQDRIGQIELLTTYIRKHFGKRPMGCWIPGMTWEQHLCTSLSASGMDYTFLSQKQFLEAGLKENEIYYPCITEDQGKIITVFPVSSDTALMLNKKNLSQVLAEIIQSMEEKKIHCGESIISVFPQKILSSSNESQDTAWNRFFEELSLSKNIVDTVLPGKIFKNLKINKKASFTNSYYIDNADNYSPRRFLIENCEANGIYSKMIFTNVLLNQLKGDKSRKQNAKEELWKAQDSYLFTPGDGFIRSDLRKSAYSSLIRAECLSRAKGSFIPSLIQHDFNLDGKKEFLFQDTKINCYIKQKGAGIFELDYLPKEWNYLDSGCGIYGRRMAFADVILPQDTEIEENKYPKKSRLMFNEIYEDVSRDFKGKCCFKSVPAGNDINFGNIGIEKCYKIKRDMLSVNYILKNKNEAEEAGFIFACEINLSFSGYTEEDVRFYTADNEKKLKDEPVQQDIKETEVLKIHDIKNEVQLLLSSANAFYGRIIQILKDGHYQASRIVLQFPVTLKGGETWKNDFSLKFSH